MRSRKKFNGYCEICKKSLCEEHAYFFVDGNNGAITNNSPYVCKECYEVKYNKKIKSDVEIFKNHLINKLRTMRTEQNIETIRIDNLIYYIENS